jgi:hypothetical protein
MEERVKTSFIPKASLATEQKQVKAGGQIALANLISGIILVLAILSAAGLFLFQQYTIQNIANERTSLERSRSAFEPATIKELSRLNTRIEAAKTLLADHVALSKLFDELEKLTLSSVRFADFSYQETQGRALLTANGQAASYNAVALQSGDFSKSALITDPIFSGVNIGKGGAIEFVFNAVIDTDHLRYTPGYAVPAAPTTPAAPSNTGTTTHQ